MYRKKIAALTAAGVFLFSSVTFAEGEENLPAVDEPFANSSEKNLSEVDAPFKKNSHSSTINRTEERGKEKISAPDEETKQKENIEEVFEEPKPAEIEEPKTPQPPPPPTETGEGLEFLMYNEKGVQAFAVIAVHEQYTLRPIVANHRIRGRNTVMKMAQELNDIATINAGYFAADGTLFGITKIDGKIVSSDYFYRSAVGINSDGSTIFARAQYSGKIIFNGNTFDVSGINCERGVNSLIVYNDYFNDTTGTNNFGVEIIEHDGIITDIQRGKGNNIIPKGGHVISAHGTAAAFFADAQIGDEIIFQESIESEEEDFNSAIHVLGAGPCLIRNGRIYIDAVEEKFPSDIRTGRAPRSAVGVTKYGDYILAVVDGRQAHSRGCTLEEWADILLNHFGAFNAINLDGGGSTELVVKDKLVNRPSDGGERPVGSGLTILPK